MHMSKVEAPHPWEDIWTHVRITRTRLIGISSKLLCFFRKTNATTSGPDVQCIEYDKELIKEVMAKMICVHEYSFRMVEHKWFNILMKCLNPTYQPIGRKAIRAECMRVFKKERELLQVALKDVDFISLTTDLWTSNQTISYMCVVAHFIDKDWKMQTRVLSFIDLDPPHSGHVISDAIYECVTEWKIEKKIISITLDNASNIWFYACCFCSTYVHILVVLVEYMVIFLLFL